MSEDTKNKKGRPKVADPVKKNRVATYLSSEELESFKAISKLNKRSVSSMLRYLVQKSIDDSKL